MASESSRCRASRRTRSLHRCFAVAVLFAIVAGLAGCQEQASPPGEPLPPTYPLWFVGDSLAAGTGGTMSAPRTYVVARGASGFGSRAWTSILDNTEAELDETGATPSVVLVMGAVNDLAVGTPAQEITDGMAHLETVLTARGSTVVWVAEPAWAHSDDMMPIHDWIRTRPHFIDCLWAAGPALLWDQNHPQAYSPLAHCVEHEVIQMGFAPAD